MASVTTGVLRNTIDGYSKKLQSELRNRQKEAVYPKYIQVSSTKDEVVRDIEIESMGALQIWPENTPAPEMTIYEGYPQSYNQIWYGGLVDITQSMIEFNKWGILDKLLMYLKESAYLAKETVATTYLEYGDVAQASTPVVRGIYVIKSLSADGNEIFDTAHTFKSSSDTWSNKSASLLTLSETGVNTAFETITRWKDSRGHPLSVNMVDIIYPPNLHLEACKTLKSMLEPDTANNAINVTPKQIKTKNGIMNRWLSDTTDWYIKTDAVDGDIKFLFGRNDKVSSRQTNVRTGNVCIRVDFAFAHGVNTPRGLYKSTA